MFLEKKWVRALISISIPVVTIVTFLLISFSASKNNASTTQISQELGNIWGMSFIGALSSVAIILFYIAVDYFDSDNLLIIILRVVFKVLGVLIILAVGGFTLLAYCISSGDGGLNIISPWLCAFGGQWLINGLIATYIFHCAAEDENKKLYPFIQLISFIISYVVTVAFAYLGHYVSSFFYGWAILIICIIMLIIEIIAVLKRNGRPPKSILVATISDMGDNKIGASNVTDHFKLHCGKSYKIKLAIKYSFSNVENSVNCDDAKVMLGFESISIPYDDKYISIEIVEHYQTYFIIKCKLPTDRIINFEDDRKNLCSINLSFS